MANLGLYYFRYKKDYHLMKYYYLMAIEYNNTLAMVQLGIYYEDVEKNNILSKKYYLMAADLNDTDAMCFLGHLCIATNLDCKGMEEWFIKAAELNSVRAMHHIGFYYNKIKKYDLMEKYLLLSIDHNILNGTGDTCENFKESKQILINYYTNIINDPIKLQILKSKLI